MTTRNRLRLAAGAAVTAGFVIGAKAARAGLAAAHRAVRGDGPLVRGITIGLPPSEVYRFLRDPTRLQTALDRVVAIDGLGQGRFRWRVAGPDDELVFITRIVIEEPDRLLVWRTEDSSPPYHGRIECRAAPGDRGTEVKVTLEQQAPTSVISTALATLTGQDLDHLLRDVLRRVKQLLECGEVIRVAGQPTGRDRTQERITRLVVERVAAGGRP